MWGCGFNSGGTFLFILTLFLALSTPCACLDSLSIINAGKTLRFALGDVEWGEFGFGFLRGWEMKGHDTTLFPRHVERPVQSEKYRIKREGAKHLRVSVLGEVDSGCGRLLGECGGAGLIVVVHFSSLSRCFSLCQCCCLFECVVNNLTLLRPFASLWVTWCEGRSLSGLTVFALRLHWPRSQFTPVLFSIFAANPLLYPTGYPSSS